MSYAELGKNRRMLQNFTPKGLKTLARLTNLRAAQGLSSRKNRSGNGRDAHDGPSCGGFYPAMSVMTGYDA